MDLPNELQVESPKLFYVDCWFGTECVPAMVDTGATANFINEDLAKCLELKATSVRDPITCQFSNGAFDFCTTKVSRQEIRFIGRERDFHCKEDFFVLKKLGLGVILSIDFVRRYGISIHPKEGFLLVPVPGKGTNLHLDASCLGLSKGGVQFHSVTNMAKLATPKQLDKNLKGGHECWVITFKEIKDHAEDLKARGAKVGPKVSAGINKILGEYQDVLSDKLPPGLPAKKRSGP